LPKTSPKPMARGDIFSFLDGTSTSHTITISV
jgi:hypothetical protein